MHTAIHYSSIHQKITEAGQIFGIQVAISDWIKAFMRYGGQDRFTFIIHQQEAMHELKRMAEEVSVPASALAFLPERLPRESFRGIDQIFRADPDPRHLYWQRNLSPDLNFNFCGLVHALAEKDACAVLERHCKGPSTATDALICPSRSIKKVVQNYFEHFSEFIRLRFNGSYACPIQLPVIPLGVDIDRIKAKVTPEKRTTQRQALGLGDDDLAVLWVGRLSYHIKAHPIAMFRAVEEAAKKTGKRIVLVMQGYFFPEEAEKNFKALASAICQTSEVHFIASNDPSFPDGLWAVGDLFLSLIDNIQESFGLTPIEAIAAGLPRILSDWDGYRESVTHGEDGFLIPTLMPSSGDGGNLAELVIGGREPPAVYQANVAQCVSVDYMAAAEAITKLTLDPALRHRLAEKARERLSAYHWQTVMEQTVTFWQKMQAQHVSSPKLPIVHPCAPDPFTMFEGFQTSSLKDTDQIRLILPAEEISRLIQHPMNMIASPMMVDGEQLQVLVQLLIKEEKQSVGQLCQALASAPHERVARTIVWLCKLGIARWEGE